MIVRINNKLVGISKMILIKDLKNGMVTGVQDKIRREAEEICVIYDGCLMI